ncbi:hypothetical protein [Celerinatantimonas sp. YJH-8]|uniref:hypothetical protein n=1 Tax=Celerinatantimonas sp. YJH-8 TaxID=3228714 RepID=UPI0038C236B0
MPLKPTLLEEELALLMAPVKTTGVHSLTRVISAGNYLEINMPDVQVIYCSSIDELIFSLISNTDIDAIILSGEQFSDKDFWLLTPLLVNMEQAQLFVYGAVPKMIPDFPDFEYCESSTELIMALHHWHTHLTEHFSVWLESGRIAISNSHQGYLQLLLPDIKSSSFLPIHQITNDDQPLLAIIVCSPQNAEICEEIQFIADQSPKLPIILIDQQKTQLANTAHHLALTLNLNVLAITIDDKHQLQAIIIRYYRRYLRWLNHHFIPSNHSTGFIYQAEQKKPVGTFQWPPRQFMTVQRYYVRWQDICADGHSHDLDQAYETLRAVYHFDYSQMVIVFEGDLPKHRHLPALTRLLARDVGICWIPASITQLLQTREQIGLTQILIPLSIWLEFVADEQRLADWQQRYQQRKIQVGLLGANKELLRYTSSLDFQLMAEPKGSAHHLKPDYQYQ